MIPIFLNQYYSISPGPSSLFWYIIDRGIEL